MMQVARLIRGSQPLIRKFMAQTPNPLVVTSSRSSYLAGYQARLSSTTNNPPKPDEQTAGKDQPPEKPMDYVVRFKGIDVKATFKKFYSLYGPLFVVSHISIGLVSLGFWCSLVWLSIDLSKIVPQSMLANLAETTLSMGESGSKFIIAYAIHKVLLPFRLGAAIFVTQKLSPRIDKWKALRKSMKTK